MWSVLARSRIRARRVRGGGDDGFSLIELVVVLGVSAFLFAALAQTLYGGLRTLAVEKARTQGNDVATQAIEDLQRFSYDELGFCTAPATPPPSDLAQTVILEGCSSSTPPAAEDSCGNEAAVGLRSAYPCTRRGITYNVRRYVSWGDAGHTAKRLAVFVDWSDQVGTHTVSQQSSVRAPGVASVIGLGPPSLSTATASPGTVLLVGQLLQSSVALSVNASGLATTDTVFAQFATLDTAGEPTSSSVFLTPNGTATTWTGSINPSDGFHFGSGSQFIAFGGVRESDGKANSAITPSVVKFCDSLDPTCSSSSLPGFTASPTVPSTVPLDPSGALQQDVTVRATTRNTTDLDSVSFSFQTRSGLVSVFMTRDTATGCDTSSCGWVGTLLRSAGYAIPAGTRPLYFTVQQVVSTDPSSVDKGSTAAIASSNVSFG